MVMVKPALPYLDLLCQRAPSVSTFHWRHTRSAANTR